MWIFGVIGLIKVVLSYDYEGDSTLTGTINNIKFPNIGTVKTFKLYVNAKVFKDTLQLQSPRNEDIKGQWKQ